ncbi:ATP-binding protein [Elusimicrobiota bacterium]
MISRYIDKQILKQLKPGKVVTLLGARRTGKTVLMEKLRQTISDKRIVLVDGENLDVAEALSSQRAHILKRFVDGYDMLFIDEAQAIPNIGKNLKLLIDTVPGISVFITGSSSMDLRGQVGEPLTGRGYFPHLYPLAQLELSKTEDYLQTKERLEEKLIYGLYPQVFTAATHDDKRQELIAIRDTYLLKDILKMDNLKDSLFVFNLLRLISFQIGNDVSYSELAMHLNVNKKTVMRYLELLEKSYILFSLPGFSRNLRKEYTKTPRYYFRDNGIRNVVISNFNSLNLRDDVGRLWENYCISERIKKMEYTQTPSNRYFWRTYDQKEIDFIEEREGKLYGFEFKWSKQKPKPPKDFLNTYRNSEYSLIHRENYLDFVA